VRPSTDPSAPAGANIPCAGIVVCAGGSRHADEIIVQAGSRRDRAARPAAHPDARQRQRFASPYIGVNGIRLDPARTHLYVSVSLDLLTRGRIYSLPLVAKPTAADLTLFHAFAPGDSPDGLAFGATGKLHVAIVLPTSSGIVVLHPDGSEERRVTNNLLTPTVPFDAPANLAFDGSGRALVVNHAAFTNLPSHFTVLDVFLDDAGDPLERPALP
jgi:sugar lactone lactonase YvrE